MNFSRSLHALSLLATLAARPLVLAADTPAAPVAPVPAPAGESTDTAIAAVYPALTLIRVVMEEGEDGRMKKMQGSGSGAIISQDGYVLTNHHVAGRGTRFVCTLSTREEVDATLVGTDALADLAIIKLDLATRRLKDQPLPVAKFGDSDKLRVGDVVLAMGSPGGLSQSITRGIVANREMIVPRHQIGMTLDGEKVGELVKWIGHDAVIYPGNSGGPLVNLAGEIVGVNEVGIASLGGAIPSNLAQKVAQELIAKGSITRSWIGLEAQPLLRGMEKEKGALVAAVFNDSPAGAAGIKAGDFITEYNGNALPDCRAAEDLPIFNAMVMGTAPGTKVTVKGIRAGQPQTWEVTTVKRDPNLGKESEMRGWSLTVRDLTRVSALEHRRTDTKGVLVDSVKTGGPAAEAKPPLRTEDIITKANDKPIGSIADMRAFTAEFTKGLTAPKPVLVSFERGREKLVTVIKVGPEPDPRKPQVAEKPWLGAVTQVITADLQEPLGVPGKKGMRITSIVPSSPAEKAGLKEGDLLLKLDGRVINASRPEDSEVLPELIRAYPVDASIEFDAIRDGQAVKLSVKLERRPQDDNELPEYKDDRFEFTARDLSKSRRVSAGVADSVKGVSIEKVESNGWAALGGLVTGDVLMRIDDREIDSIATLKTLLTAFRETKPRRITLFVQRGTRTLFLEIEPRW
ncbi:MAG TPA: PDZ domain-containing protein [Verrucomicrobiales bacterium]|nr:PDZ domain-containing protein [Verrucomicrobiales bacterium]